ncbi:MAG TPA: type VI secretion protein IcmF/TssM N-terminal domain-containing protein [Pirellulaceae bacterium]|nr:type VI secretion protein IcmF/TssM N-terminal domain-containing protein [Pirellulaceae bacterium]
MNAFAQLLTWLSLPIRLLLAVPLKIVSAPKRLMGMSLPARVAVLVAVFCVLIVAFAYTLFLMSEGSSNWANYFEGWRIVVLPALVIAIPIIVYFVLKMWLEGHGSPFPDIDLAWKSGVAELSRHGIDLSATPLFLVLGVKDEESAKSLFAASGLSFRVKGAPEGTSALHWYGDPNGIFLVCTEACRMTKLLRSASRQGAKLENPGAAVASSGGKPNLRGTIVVGDSDSLRESSPSLRASNPEPAPEWASSANLRGTLVIGTSPGETAAGGGSAASSGASTIGITPSEADEETARLEYVCYLLRRARQPLVPLNGILTILPFDVIERGPREAAEIQRAVRADLAAVHRSAQTRCPVTAMVAGMETEAGFRELVRRVGSDRAKNQRFGKGYSVWSPPAAEQLDAVASHACGAFEDWVYTLFKERDGFNKPGNAKLYQLLCKIRSDLSGRLKLILVNGYASDADGEPNPEPLLFSGCYFAATGASDDRQAFVRSVVEKMLSEEAELEWTEAALIEDDRYQSLANGALAFTGLMTVAIVGMLVKKYVG